MVILSSGRRSATLPLAVTLCVALLLGAAVRLYSKDGLLRPLAGELQSRLLARSSSALRGMRNATTGKLVIHCFAYNRPDKFKRMWESLMSTASTGDLPTSVVIHVDRDDAEGPAWRAQVSMVVALVATGTCEVGPVTAVFAAQHKGVTGSMMEAWAPMPHEYAMFLSDDVEVSPVLPLVAGAFVDRYGETSDGAEGLLGFRLENQLWSEMNLRFQGHSKLANAPYKTRDCCSWGTVYTPSGFRAFVSWFVANSHRDPYIPQFSGNAPQSAAAALTADRFLRRFMWEKKMHLISVNLPGGFNLVAPQQSPGTVDKSHTLLAVNMALSISLPFPPGASLTADESVRAGHDDPSPAVLQELNGPDLPAANVLNPRPGPDVREMIVLSETARLLRMFRMPRDKMRANLNSFRPESDVALRRLLLSATVDDAKGLPATFVSNLDNLVEMFCFAFFLHGPESNRALVVDTQYGLTNRLRAYASTKAIADASARQFIVLWELDAHCAGELDKVFNVPLDVILLNSSKNFRLFLQFSSVTSKFQAYDLMNPGMKFTPVKGDSPQHLFIRSAFQVYSKKPYQSANLVALRELANAPAKAVRDLMKPYFEQLRPDTSRTPDAVHASLVGVHIRMVASVGKDTPGLKPEEALRMELATAFRLSCHYKHFLEKMLTYPKGTRFFVSTDSPEAFNVLSQHASLKDRVFQLSSRACTERTAECLAFAAADLLLLSKTKELLTSKWSAFSETASKISGRKSENGCEQPPGGWLVGGPKKAFRDQVIKYLTDRSFPGVDRVAKAFDQF